MKKSWLGLAYYIIKNYKVTLLGSPKVNLESHYLPKGLLIALVTIKIFLESHKMSNYHYLKIFSS